ncbi:hypothetical protein BDV93DRAFT_523805 [Ceratobasidium sp. AG-I]|nr:hypothetical protein BDV93DRAFT_523805 [Ceratobasidium sp. AG-I]
MPARPKPDELWGPPLSKYVDEFEQRTPGSPDFAMNIPEIYPADRTGFTPLSAIARSFVTLEGNHILGKKPTEQALVIPLAALRKYHETNKKIFAHLYGFLCFKVIIRVIEDALLMTAGNGSLNFTLMNHSPEDDPSHIFNALTVKAMTEINAALQGHIWVGKVLGMSMETGQKALPFAGGISEQDLKFLTEVLSQDRKSYLNLCNRGLLNGSTSLFFVTTALGRLVPRNRLQDWFTQLNDVLLRYYLSTPDFETITLRNLCLSVESELTSKVVDRSAVDLEDARAIVQSYIRIFSPPLTVEIHAPHLLDISTLLFEIAYDNLAPKYMQDLIPDMMKAALARLWLEYDAEQNGVMPPQRRGFSRRYMGEMCHYIRLMKEKMIGDEGLSTYARMLLDIDIVGLLGRTLLLITRDSQPPDRWEELLDGLGDLNNGLRNPVSFAQMAFSDSHGDWIKVFRHFRLLLGGAGPRYLSHDLTHKATQAWLEIGLSMRFARSASTAPGPSCSNPYCIEPLANDSSIGAHLTCKQCKVARYCDRTCQNAHWELKSALSHVNECVLRQNV